MENNSDPISPSSRANLKRVIPTRNNPEHLLLAKSESFKTIVYRNMASEGHLADEQKTTAKPAGRRVRSTANMVYLLNNTDLSKAVEETENAVLERPAATDLVLSLETELLRTMEAEVRLAVGAVIRKILRKTVEITPRDMFLDGCEVTDEEVKKAFYKFIKYVLAHMIVAARLDAILARNVHKWLCSVAFMFAKQNALPNIDSL